MRLRIGLVIAVVALAASLLGISRAAVIPLGDQFRVSTMGADGDATRGAFDAAVAYSTHANEYLVVWAGEGFATDDEFEIFGQRVSATGAELGGDFRISTTGTDGDPNREPGAPAVAYNTQANEYLVVWQADGLPTDDKWEMFGQRLSASGAELGGDFRISNTGTEGDASTDVFDRPAVAYNSQANEYLVAWLADGLGTGDEVEVFGQRLSGGGAELGGDFRISTVGTDGDTTRSADRPTAAYSPQANQYLVVWAGDHTTDDEYEVFGQLLSAAGADVGGDFLISSRGAIRPAIAHSSQANEYLVVWSGQGPTEIGTEVIGQRLSASGAKLGGDFAVSTTGPSGDTNFRADSADVSYNAPRNEYLVVWHADGLGTPNELEIFAQRLSAAGAELEGEFRVSTTGTEGDAARDALSPTVAGSTQANEYLVAWRADALPTDNESEIFARRVGEPPPPTAGPCTITGTPGNDVLTGTTGPDFICALGGSDRVFGLGGNDTILLGAGNDRAFGGAGRDTIRGAKGADRISGGKGRDRLFGERGRDLLLARDRVRDLVNGGLGFDRARVDRRRDTRRSIERLF